MLSNGNKTKGHTRGRAGLKALCAGAIAMTLLNITGCECNCYMKPVHTVIKPVTLQRDAHGNFTYQPIINRRK